MKLTAALVLAVGLCGLFHSTTSAEQPVTWTEVEQWTREDSARYGVDTTWMLSIAWCEGRGNPYARGLYGEVGPFQFLPTSLGVWWELPESRLVALDYTRTSLRLQVQAAVNAFRAGLSSRWTCAR